eukprot:m.48603 g.48603  ORF g.48603 m.48603 type:complete len:97 (-) comp6434_c0_seq3:180-470(-)
MMCCLFLGAFPPPRLSVACFFFGLRRSPEKAPPQQPPAHRQHDKLLEQHNERQMRKRAQLTALQHASARSGFYIGQDSSFGNLILPVVPRLDPRND